MILRRPPVILRHAPLHRRARRGRWSGRRARVRNGGASRWYHTWSVLQRHSTNLDPTQVLCRLFGDRYGDRRRCVARDCGFVDRRCRVGCARRLRHVRCDRCVAGEDERGRWRGWRTRIVGGMSVGRKRRRDEGSTQQDACPAQPVRPSLASPLTHAFPPQQRTAIERSLNTYPETRVVTHEFVNRKSNV